MSGYDAGPDMESLRTDLGLGDDASAAQIMASLWAKIDGSSLPANPTIPDPIERAARALCAHLGTDPDQTAQRLNETGREYRTTPAWMDYVEAVKVVLEAVKPPSSAA